MATATAMPTHVPSPMFKPLIMEAAPEEGKANVFFDPAVHLQYERPSEIIMMEDIGYPASTGVSKVAVSQPFQLFSKEAIRHMRSQLFTPEVMSDCKYSSNIAACQLRGYASKHAPFIHDAWHSPETLAIVSEIAGIDLVPAMDFEVGHVNVSVKSKEQTEAELRTIEQKKRFFQEDEGIAGCPWEDDKPVVGWHTDSYPFVCVLMMSDCTQMVGGETALRTGTGEILKVRGPEMGRYITHEALRALGTQERITMVTSFRPKSPLVADDSVLTTVRPISDLSELYYEFSEYRLEIVEARVRDMLKTIRNRRRAGRKFDSAGVKHFLSVQERFLSHTNGELVPEAQVIKGFIDEMDIPDATLDHDETATSTSPGLE